MSGMTRSMPSIPSSGNMRPASMTTMSSPDSSASMFLPISPTPPSGMTRSGLAKERDLFRRLLRLFGLGRPRRLSGEVQRESGEVREERVAERRLMERRGRVVDREDDETILHARFSVDARDGLAWEELSHGVTAERHDDLGAEQGEMATQPHVTGDDFVRERIAVLGRSVANHVRDEDFPAVETDAGEELVEELPCRPHERLALHV